MAEAARYLREMNKRYGHTLERIPEAAWPPMPALQSKPTEVWRSRDYLLMVWQDRGYERLSVLRTALEGSGRYLGGISWDDLQRLKAECGRGSKWAVEVFPPDTQIVDVQNMRHLFVLKAPPEYGWRDAGGEGQGGHDAT